MSCHRKDSVDTVPKGVLEPKSPGSTQPGETLQDRHGSLVLCENQINGWHRSPSIVPQRREDALSLKTHIS